MATTMKATMKSRIDENQTTKFKETKKMDTAIIENTKRSALCDLQNPRVLPNAVHRKEAVKQSIINSSKNHVYGRTTVKPLVTVNPNKAPVVGAIAKIAPKTQLGTNSLKADVVGGAQNTTRTCSNARRLATTVAIGKTVKLSKPKTKASKDDENKEQQVKQIITSNPKDKNTALKIVPILRREESILPRKPLIKPKVQDADKNAEIVSDVSKTSSTTVDVSRDVVQKSKNGSQDENVVLELVTEKVDCQDWLLKEVEDIDANDSNNLILVSEYVNEIYDYLYDLETKFMIGPDYLSDQKEIYPKMRAVLIDWINEVHMQFRLLSETFQIAVGIIDMYLQVVKDTKRSHLQLVGVVALFIAAKYEELLPPPIGEFVYITDDTYKAEEIIQMEMKIMKAIDFNLSRPLPIHFLRRFSKAADAEEHYHAMSKYFVELCLVDFTMVQYRQSEIAAASILLALNLLSSDDDAAYGFDDSLWTRTLEWHSRYSCAHLRPIARKIAKIARDASNAKLKAVYMKYQSQQLMKISSSPKLSGPLIESIIRSEDEMPTVV